MEGGLRLLPGMGSEEGWSCIWECEREEAEAIVQGIDAFEEGKRWAPYSCCYGCGLPQSICSSFLMDSEKGGYRKEAGERCQYDGVLVRMVMGLWVRHVQVFGDLIERCMEMDGWRARSKDEEESGPTMEAIVKWFCEKKRWGGIEGNKISWFALQLSKQVGL